MGYPTNGRSGKGVVERGGITFSFNTSNGFLFPAINTFSKPSGMRKILLAIVTALNLATSYAQKTEFIVSLNSGLFSFRGESAQKTSMFYYADEDQISYNNPYGAKSGLSYGASVALKRVTKTNVLVGLDAGYEMLQSKILIHAITHSIYTSSFTPATGHTYLNSSFINIFPSGGYRFSCRNINIDLTGGLDIGFCTGAKQKTVATASNGEKYESSIDRKMISTDIRPRIQVSAYYNVIGVYAGYSMGLVNYKSDYWGGDSKAYSNMVRLGIIWRIL